MLIGLFQNKMLIGSVSTICVSIPETVSILPAKNAHVAHASMPLYLYSIFFFYAFSFLSSSLVFPFPIIKGKIPITRTMQSLTQPLLLVDYLTRCKTEQNVQGHNH